MPEWISVTIAAVLVLASIVMLLFPDTCEGTGPGVDHSLEDTPE